MDKKYLDQKLAERLFPVYCEGGGKIVTVWIHCKKEGIEISKPTLGKMADAFFWKTKYEEQQRNEFASNTGNDLDTLLQELTNVKNTLKEKTDTESIRVFGTVITRIVDIKKVQIAERAVDRNALLLEMLTGVVEFYITGNKKTAEQLSDDLEAITDHIKKKW